MKQNAKTWCRKCNKYRVEEDGCTCQVDKHILLVQDLVSKEWVVLAESVNKEAVQAEYNRINEMGDNGPKLIIFTGDFPTL